MTEAAGLWILFFFWMELIMVIQLAFLLKQGSQFNKNEEVIIEYLKKIEARMPGAEK